MSFLYEYMTESELNSYKNELQIEMESVEIEHAFAIAKMEHNVRLAEIEKTCIFEKYTAEDLEDAYMQERVLYEGTIGDLWEKFKNWVKGIIDAILGRNKKDGAFDLNGDVEIDVDVDKATGALKSVSDTIKKIVSFKDENGNIDKSKITIAGISIATGTGAILALFNSKKDGEKKKIKKTELKSKWDSFVSALNDLKNTIFNHTPKNEADGEKEHSWIRELVNPIVKAANGLSNKIESLLKGNKNTNNSENTETEETDSETPDSDETKDNESPKNEENKTENNKDNEKTTNQESKSENNPTFDSKKKNSIKSEMLRFAKSINIIDKKLGNKVTLSEMKRFLSEFEKKKSEGKLKNITDDMMKQFKDCISWMEDNNINEFTVDMDLFNTMVLMEAYDSCDIETDDYFESVSFDSSELDELVSFI